MRSINEPKAYFADSAAFLRPASSTFKAFDYNPFNSVLKVCN